MEADGFLIKYINLMRCDQPLNSLPFIFFCAIFAFVEANVTIAIIVEPENSEKILIAVADIMVCTLVASLTVFRSLNPENSFQLAELIEEDLCGWHDWRVGKNSINLKIEIEDYYAEKKKQTKTMNNNIAYSFSVLFVLVENRNIINYLSRTPTSQFETTGWPTPFLSYCPLYLKSEIFFIYTYILHSFLVLCYMVEGFYVITTTYLSTEKIIIVCDTISILASHLAIDFPDGDDLKRNGGDLNKNEEYLKEDGENFGMNREDLGNSERDLDKSRGDLKMREDFKGREKYLENSYSREQNLRQDMGRIVYCHQKVNRNFRKFDHSSRLLMTISNLLVMLYSCALAYLVLTTDDLMKGINFAVLFVCLNLTMFVAHHNGQRLFNQNDILRRTLAELPWTDKPQWFKQTLHIMMTRANVDIEMRPYGIFSLNYLSFKDLMKTAFSIGNIFYTKKLTSQA